jgi:anti-sigma factor RsiW
MNDDRRSDARTRARHPPDLLAYVAGQLETEAKRDVEAHLGTCPACREEVDALVSMSETLNRCAREDYAPERALRPGARSRNPWKLACVAAVAALVVVAAVAVVLSRRPTPRVMQADGSVVFAAPQRSDGAMAELRGSGPWSISVLLPYTAPDGAYRARIQAGASILAEVTADSDADGRVTLLVQELSTLGEYELSLEPVAPPGEARYVYPFSVGHAAENN